MATLSDNIYRAVDNFDNIKTAITTKLGSFPSGDIPVEDYDDLILSIPSGSGKNASALVRPTFISQGTGYTAWIISTYNSVISDSFAIPLAFVWSGGDSMYFWISLGGVNSIVVIPTPYQSTQMPFFARFSASDASGLTLMVRDTTIQLSNTLSFGSLTNPETFTPNIIEVSGVMSAVVGANKTLNIHKLFVRFISEV